jgi:PiT family inorganic phosphate transporter
VDSGLLLAVVIAAALGFGLSNGALDAPTFLSPLISTRSVSPRLLVVGAAVLNFAGAFLTLEVAVTLSERIFDPMAIEGSEGLEVVLAALAGALAWTLVTSNLGLPPSSSHALIGGLAGSFVAAAGLGGIEIDSLLLLALVPAILAPSIAFLIGGLMISALYRVLARARPGPTGRRFRLAQHFSGGLLALAHGSNDAQKTMGVILLALIADGSIAQYAGTPFWVIVAAAVAIAAGTLVGARRVPGRPLPRVMKMDPAQGFVSQVSSGFTILAASLAGFPLSTTQVMNGGVIGSGLYRGRSARRWGLARTVVRAWILTFPATAVLGGLAFVLSGLVGGGLAGGLAIVVVTVGVVVPLIGRLRSRPRPH